MTINGEEHQAHQQTGKEGLRAMSEVTKIHTVDGSILTVDYNFIVCLNNMPSVAKLQSFNNKILVNMGNVTYMEVVSDDDDQ